MVLKDTLLTLVRCFDGFVLVEIDAANVVLEVEIILKEIPEHTILNHFLDLVILEMNGLANPASQVNKPIKYQPLAHFLIISMELCVSFLNQTYPELLWIIARGINTSS